MTPRDPKRNLSADDVIAALALEPLPGEGGFFRRTYCSGRIAAVDGKQIALASAIYYLITRESFSALHRVQCDEMFHFYAGDAVEMWEISERGAEPTILGAGIMEGQVPQKLVASGTWQGCRLLDGGAWALLGATVVPAFEWDAFELGNRSDLLREFPQYRRQIEKLTYESAL